MRGGGVRLYVQIPAYRDPELSATLLDLYRRADEPEALRTCVLWQRDQEILNVEVGELPNLELHTVSYRESRGANWAREFLQSRWKDEPYTLFLDSHHRFVDGWDTQLVGLFEQCCSRSSKPLLTAYLPSYEPRTDPLGRRQEPYKTYPLAREDGVISQLTSYPIPFWELLSGPIEADFISLHFIFTVGEFNREVCFDPEIYYLRDEVVASVQAFTHGYDFFHPHRVVGWHCYDRESRRAHWLDHENWHANQHTALAKMKRLFLGEESGQLGRERSIREYENRIMSKLVTP
jgi:hypothetical protein